MWWRQGFFFPLLTPGSEEEEEDVKPAAIGGRESEKLLEQIKNILARAVSPKRKENKRRTGGKSAHNTRAPRGLGSPATTTSQFCTKKIRSALRTRRRRR